VGLPWEDEMGLDIICERLWDMARLAYYDEERASNYAARKWISDQDEVQLPVDHRPLRDKSMPTSSNVVKYQRRNSPAAVHPVAKPARGNEDVFFIGEETPTPAVPRRRSRGEDEGTLYIGFE
jgi:hypothetical protein